MKQKFIFCNFFDPIQSWSCLCNIIWCPKSSNNILQLRQCVWPVVVDIIINIIWSFCLRWAIWWFKKNLIFKKYLFFCCNGDNFGIISINNWWVNSFVILQQSFCLFRKWDHGKFGSFLINFIQTAVIWIRWQWIKNQMIFLFLVHLWNTGKPTLYIPFNGRLLLPPARDASDAWLLFPG